MFVEFKTRSGDKWTALRHYDSGPWSGGGNPHWSAINVTLRSVKNNAGIAERKKDADDWPHYPAQWSNARGLWDFTAPAETFISGMHARLTSDNAGDIEGFKFSILNDALRPPVAYTALGELLAAVHELPEPEPNPPEAEEIGEGVPERAAALEAQVQQLQEKVQQLEQMLDGAQGQSSHSQ